MRISRKPTRLPYVNVPTRKSLADSLTAPQIGSSMITSENTDPYRGFEFRILAYLDFKKCLRTE